MSHTIFWVSVNGTEISTTLAPILKSLTISDTDGGKADSLEIELADDGSIALPPTNAPIQAGIAHADDGDNPVGMAAQFEGLVERCEVGFSRRDGRSLTISAQSVDFKGKPKAHHQAHHDKGKFSEVAKRFGEMGGLQVEVADGLDVERPYWAMQGESFLNWGMRTAQEMGATFKVRGNRAIFAQRSAGQSLGGLSLPTVRAIYGVNIISGNLSPMDDRQNWQQFQTRYYDTKEARYKTENVEARSRPGSVTHLDRFTRTDQDTAKARGRSNAAESERDQGGGTIVIDGDPTAQAEGTCLVSGVSAGVDGPYRIKTARQRFTRANGWTTELTLGQPSEGGAGGSGE